MIFLPLLMLMTIWRYSSKQNTTKQKKSEPSFSNWAVNFPRCLLIPSFLLTIILSLYHHTHTHAHTHTSKYSLIYQAVHFTMLIYWNRLPKKAKTVRFGLYMRYIHYVPVSLPVFCLVLAVLYLPICQHDPPLLNASKIYLEYIQPMYIY